jgi:hypothetical protein
MFGHCASSFTVYYVSGTTGWSNPWHGYPTAVFVLGAHTLTTTASPLAGGTITKSPDETSYPFGTVVTLTASANSGYTFSSWTGATPVTGHPDQATVTMDADKTVTAIFTDNTGDFQYTVAGGTATITKYTGAGGAVVIPTTLGGYPVTSIGDYAFYGCSFLTSVTIPDSVTSIGGGVFGSCSSMTSITVDPANGSYSSIDGVLFNKMATLLMQCPGGKQGAYVIPNSVTSIGDWGFAGSDALPSVTIPNSVTSIGNGAFQGCSRLTAAYFLGNAPTGTSDMFASCASGFTVYYVSGTTGWTNPWYGYPTATFVPVTPGDITGDGTVTMLDALQGARAAVGITTLTGSAFDAADLNHDGTITMLDVLLIARLAVGITH